MQLRSQLIQTLVICLIFIGKNASLSWNEEPTGIPSKIAGCAVGYNAYTESIWLLSQTGKYGTDSFMEYDIYNETFIKHSSLQYAYEYQDGESYTQIGNQIYIDASTNYIAMFDMDTEIYTPDFITKSSAWSTGQPCMTSAFSRYLLIVAGYSNEFRIYDLLNNIWLNNGPNIPETSRAGCSCIIHTYWLYVFGGWYGSDFTDVIIKINIQDMSTINERNWVTLDRRLHSEWSGNGGCGGMRTVKHNDWIYAICGYWPWEKNVNIIDVSRDLTTNDVGYLVSARTVMAAVIARTENILYLFGGHYSDFNGSMNYQWSVLPDVIPSPAPTFNPSVSPTEATFSPTIQPTFAPTINGTIEAERCTTFRDNDNAVITTIYCIFGVFFILFIVNTVHSKYSYKDICDCCLKCGCKKADSNRSLSLMIVSFRIGDFITDFALTIQIFGTTCPTTEENGLLYVLVIGSAISLFLPYILNILFMFGYIKQAKNILIEQPSIYFKKYVIFYIFVVLITSDAYTATMFISSNILGLEIFNAGLNSIQFRSVRGFKICNIIFENIPQSIIQFVFGLFILKEVDALILVSLVFSLLSSVSNIISWFLNKNIDKQWIKKQYFLKIVPDAKSNEIVHINNEYNKFEKFKRCTRKLQYEISKKLKAHTIGAKAEKEMPSSCTLEIGFITTNKLGGCTINIIHYIINSKQISNKNPKDIIKSYYDNKYEGIAAEVKRFFKLTSDIKVYLEFDDEQTGFISQLNNDTFNNVLQLNYNINEEKQLTQGTNQEIELHLTQNINNKDEEKEGKCAQCGEIKQGKMDDNENIFYCNDCWNQYGDHHENDDKNQHNEDEEESLGL